MKWIKQGLIFSADNNFEWMASHASIPVPDRLSAEVLRIYFGTRDQQGRSHIAYVDVEPTIPGRLFIFPIGLSYRWAERALLTTAGGCPRGLSIAVNANSSTTSAGIRRSPWPIGYRSVWPRAKRKRRTFLSNIPKDQSATGASMNRSLNTAPCVLLEKRLMAHVVCLVHRLGNHQESPRAALSC